MNRKTWLYLAAGAIVVGTVFTFLIVAVHWQSLAAARGWLIVATIISGLALIPLAKCIGDQPSEAEAFERDKREFEQAQAEAERELRRQLQALDRRQQELANRFLQYQAWMEYPLPAEETEADKDEESSETTAHEGQTPEELQTLRLQDKQVAELLERESARLFDKIKANEYVVEGQFQLESLRDDLVQLITDVARVYQPDAKNPLLETSVHKLLRAGARTCLHLLVLLERLPLNVAAQNIVTLHGYLRQGLRAYKAYQAVQPYLPYLQYATYAGRALLGANPVGLGAQWALWKIGSKGATAATKHIINRQALGFLHDSVVVIGGEVAEIYGDDFRHRDRQWLYATELTELMSQFPMTREGLLRAFAEIGRLPMRNEYDRVFLYRCIAMHRSADPDRFRAGELLNQADRQWIVRRLEKHFNRTIADRDRSRVSRWSEGVEKRLGVAPQVDVHQPSMTSKQAYREATRAIINFLVIDRQSEFENLPELLGHSRVATELPEEEVSQLIEEVRQTPASLFELPDVDSEGPATDPLLADLAKMIALTANDGDTDPSPVLLAGDYFRRDKKQVESVIDREFRGVLNDRADEGAILGTPTFAVIQAALAILEPDDRLQLLIDSVNVEPESVTAGEDACRFALIGGRRSLGLFQFGRSVDLVWRADGTTGLEISRKLLKSIARISGGKWEREEWSDASIVVGRISARAGQDSFAALSKLIEEIAE